MNKFIDLFPKFGFMFLQGSIKTIEEHDGFIFMGDVHGLTSSLLSVACFCLLSLSLLWAHNREAVLVLICVGLAKDTHDIIFDLELCFIHFQG